MLCDVFSITDVWWDNQKIVVMDQVTIVPPYLVENCKGKDGSKALQHVKKIVSTHKALGRFQFERPERGGGRDRI